MPNNSVSARPQVQLQRQPSAQSASSYGTAASSTPPAFVTPPSSPASSYRSARSSTGAGHLAIDIPTAQPLDPIERAARTRDLRALIGTNIDLVTQALQDSADAKQLVVPGTFINPPNTDRQAAYREYCQQGLNEFAEDMTGQLVAAGYTKDTLQQAFEAVSAKDGRKAAVIAALERVPFIASMALLNLCNPYGEPAYKADHSKGPKAGAITGGLTNASAALLQMAWGPYIRGVASGPDPYHTQPAPPKMNPKVGRAIAALPPITFERRFKATHDAARGILTGNLVGGVASIGLTAAGVPAARSVPTAIALRAAAQLGSTADNAGKSGQKVAEEQFLKGLLQWVSRTNFAESAEHAHDSMLTWRNAAEVAKKAGQVVISPVTSMVPPAIAPGWVGQPKAVGNQWVPPAIKNVADPESILVAGGFIASGALGGAADYAAANELSHAHATGPGELALQAAVKAAGNHAVTRVNVASLAAGNTFKAERQASEKIKESTAVPDKSADKAADSAHVDESKNALDTVSTVAGAGAGAGAGATAATSGRRHTT